MRRRKRDNNHWEKVFSQIRRNQKALMDEYAEISISAPETMKWDYAIPENYTNYQDGFIFPDFESYRGAPIFDLTRDPLIGEVLYLRWEVPYHVLEKHEAEKFLCFDRHGRKYTVLFTAAPMEDGNPSYFRFLPKVKKYIGGKHRGTKTD